MAVRYCYIVQGSEIDIVGVWSSRDEAINEAKNHVKDSGTTKFEVNDINDDFVYIRAIKGEMLENASVKRFIIQ